MRLESGGRAVQLRPVRYQFPDRAPGGGRYDWDANWLQVRGDVIDGDLAWHFEDPCLTTREARELHGWLQRVVDGDVSAGDRAGDGRIWFTEPNVHFALTERTGDSVTIVVSFAQESSPPGATEEIRYGDGHGVALRVSTADLRRAAEAWERELHPFPER